MKIAFNCSPNNIYGRPIITGHAVATDFPEFYRKCA